MDKPYLIIVDDEKDMRDNIREEAINRGLDDILNLRARGSTEKALELLHKIKEEDGEVACLLTDMQMEDRFSGLRLCEETDKIFANSFNVVLTGYAHKDSAVLAMNQGMLDAYFEKESDHFTKEMFPTINQGLMQFFNNTHNDIAIVYRTLVENAQQFGEYATGRYLIWQDQGWRKSNPQWMDIDEFDFFSYMLCAFEHRINRAEFAGGLRRTSPEKESGNRSILQGIMEFTHYQFGESDLKKINKNVRVREQTVHDISDLIGFIKNRFGNLSNDQMYNTVQALFPGYKFDIDLGKGKVIEYHLDNVEMECPLPAFKVHNDEGQLDRAYQKIRDGDPDREMHEVGRLGLMPKFRTSYHGNRINLRLQEEMAAQFIFEGVSDCIICINPAQYEPFGYKGLGFVPIEGVKLEDYYKHAPSRAYRLDFKNFQNPEKVVVDPAKRFRVMEYLKKMNSIAQNPEEFLSCSCKNLKQCLKEDYQKPITEPVDYHCPIRVQRYLGINGGRSK